MKLRQLFGGALAAALVVTSMPVTGLVAFADQGDIGAEDGIEKTPYVYQRLTSDFSTWKVSTDAGAADGSSIENILKDDDKWISADAVETTAEADSQAEHPVKDITLARNNNYYLKINDENGIDISKLMYYCCNTRRNGKILKAKVYVSKDASERG